MGIFSNAQGQLTLQYVVKSGRTLNSFKTIYLVVLVTCKNEEDPIKNQNTRKLTSLKLDFFRHSRAAYSQVGSGIPPKFKLVQAFIIVLITLKNKKDPIKNEGSRVLQDFSHYKSGFFSNAQGQLNPQSLVNLCRNSSK